MSSVSSTVNCRPCELKSHGHGHGHGHVGGMFVVFPMLDVSGVGHEGRAQTDRKEQRLHSEESPTIPALPTPPHYITLLLCRQQLC